MNYEDFKLKKGDKVNFTYEYPKGHSMCGPVDFEGIFDNYMIVDHSNFVIKFGPRNLKKAQYVLAIIYYTNEYGVKIKFPIKVDNIYPITLIN